MIYGVDISNYQAELTNFGGLKNDGFDFAFILSSDGTDFRNVHFARQLDGCRGVNQLTAAYHYIRDASIAEQIRNVRSQVPLDVPVIPDSEKGSGGVHVLRSMVSALQAEGYKVPLTYLPRWYWNDHIGQPDLSGLPPLWISWYPDYKTRSKEDGAAQLPAHVWNGYGGLSVAVAQYTSSGRVSGYGGAIDQNVYRGTRDELAALLGGNQEDLLMALPQWQQDRLFERVLAMSAGVDGQNFNGRQFEHEEARRNATDAKIDAIATVVAQLAENDEQIELDDAQKETLTTSVSEQVDASIKAAEAANEEQLATLAEVLSDKLDTDKDTVLGALKEYYQQAS